jgi:hypothetical protein
MTRQEHDRLKEMFVTRSWDFWASEEGEFEAKAWRGYLKKIKVGRIEDYDLPEAFNNKKEGIVMIEDPREDLRWFLMTEDLAAKSLLLGQLPPRYSKKPKAKG